MDLKGDLQQCRAGSPSISEKCAENFTVASSQHCMDGDTNTESTSLTPSLCHFCLSQKNSLKLVVNFSISNGKPISQTKVNCTMIFVGIRDRDLRLHQDIALNNSLAQQGVPLWQALLRFVAES